MTTHSYNADDSLSGSGYTNEVVSTPDVAYTYDTYYARVATMVDGIGTTTYTYVAPGTNGAGQVASVDGPLSNDTIGYTYDELGRVIQRSINGTANQVDWTFDMLGRVTSEENLLGEFTYTYHGVANRLNTVTYPNGQTSTYSYLDDEQDHRLETILHKYPNAATLSKFDYTYDAAGNILTWRQQADTTAVLWRYGYDQADQLTAAVKHATDTPQTVLKRYAYAYDPAGNRTVEQIDDAITLSAHDNLNRLTSQAPGGPMVVAGSLNEPGTVTISGVPTVVDASNNFRGTVPTMSGTNTFTIVAKDVSGNTTTNQYEVSLSGSSKTFTYDANGNLTADGTRSFEWDAVNRLVEAQVSADAWQFTYDASGRRVAGSFAAGGMPSIESTYLWCGFSPCEERDAATNAVARRLYGAGEAAGSAQRFVTSDHLQSARDVVLNGSVEGRAEFDPWGRATSVGPVNVATAYAGQQKHLGAPINLTMYRQYDAESGRWLSEDPAGAVDGPNLRAYTRNNPLRYSDPLGLCSCDDECPSGEWDVSYTSLTVGMGVGMDVGHGRIMCRGKPEISRPARIGCVLFGAFAGVGVSGGTSFWTPAITGPCKRSDLQITRSTGWVGMTPLISVSGSDGAVTGISSSWGKWGAGFAFSDCMLTPM